MATYTGTMFVGGEKWSDTAYGYQIAGDDAADANATCALPDTYTTYKKCSITCTLFAKTAPTSWSSNWGCYLGIYKNGSLFGGGTQWINKSYFQSGTGESGRVFKVNLTNGTFKADDQITIKFIGSDGGYVDGSGRCVYLTAAEFYSDEATAEYVLSFNANGGSGAPGAVSGEAGDSGQATIEIPAKEPTRSGHLFMGWATTAGATSAEYAAGGTIDLSQNTTLYAVWMATSNITLKFSANGGSGAPGPESKETDSSGTATFTVPQGKPTRSGYTFLGWATTDKGSAEYDAGDTIELSQNTTLYAVWEAVIYRIAYDVNGADSGAAPNDATEYIYGTKATLADNSGGMALEGHIFGGWNTAANGSGTTYVPGSSLTIMGGLTLYAMWVPREQVYVYTAYAWEKGSPQIFNGMKWPSGELGLQVGGSWTPEPQVVGATLFLPAGAVTKGVLSLPLGAMNENTLEV